MSRRIYFDGLNLALARGTGIATYTRLLAGIVRELGYEIGVVYSSRGRPSKNPILGEISLLDRRDNERRRFVREVWETFVDQVHHRFGVKPRAFNPSGPGVTDQFRMRMPAAENVFVARNLFANARRYFSWSGRFTDLKFDTPPDILHCTYQLPLRAKSACNIYTIHDLVPLRLPFATLDNKRQTYRLLRKIGAEADHIVTVSEHSKRDIIELLGVDEKRVTNTYEVAEFPRELLERPNDVIAEELHRSFGLTPQNYLLFYGALEPKKNVERLFEAYMLSTVTIPLVITGAVGWANEAETRWLKQMREEERAGRLNNRRICHFEYASLPMLVSLIRGARAVLFPSLYEGFGLPVLEAMQLGAPVVTSRTSSMPEIAGDAALYVNPYDVDDIARAIRTITADAGLREELVLRGRAQAELFSLARYRERVAALYERLR